MHGHFRARHFLKRDRVRTGSEYSVRAQPLCTIQTRARAVSLRYISCGIVEQPRPSCAQQDNVAGPNFDSLRRSRVVEMLTRDLEVFRQSLYTEPAGDVEQDSSPKNRRNGIDRVLRNAIAVPLR